MSAICLLVLTYLIWIPESKFIVSNIPSRFSSVGSGNVSHSWTSSFDDHLDHRIAVFRNEKRCSMAGDVNDWKNRTNAVRVLFDSLCLGWLRAESCNTHRLPCPTN